MLRVFDFSKTLQEVVPKIAELWILWPHCERSFRIVGFETLLFFIVDLTKTMHWQLCLKAGIFWEKFYQTSSSLHPCNLVPSVFPQPFPVGSKVNGRSCMHDSEHGLFDSICQKAIIMEKENTKKKRNVCRANTKFSWIVFKLVVFVAHAVFCCFSDWRCTCGNYSER